MEGLIPDLNADNLTAIIAFLVLAYLIFDKAGMIRRPKFLGGKKNSNHNPGRHAPTACPFANAEHLLPPDDRKLIHNLINVVTEQNQVFARKDATGAYELLVCLRDIETNTRMIRTYIKGLKP